MSGIQHTCGRFMSNCYATADMERIRDVRGDCAKHGKDVSAANGWWDTWEAWTHDDDEEVAA